MSSSQPRTSRPRPRCGCPNDEEDRLCNQSTSQAYRRRILPLMCFLVVLPTLILLSIFDVDYLFVGYIIFFMAIAATGVCEVLYAITAVCIERAVTKWCPGGSADDQSGDESVINQDPESLEAWASRSMSVDPGSYDNGGVGGSAVGDAPPSYDDVIDKEDEEEPPPPSYNEVFGIGSTDEDSTSLGAVNLAIDETCGSEV